MNNQAQLENFGKQLHELGDQMVDLADRLKQKGEMIESDELYGLGNEVEHFFDQWSEEKNASAQEKSSSTVNNNQVSG